MAKPGFNVAGTDGEAWETLRQWWEEYGKYAGAGLVLAFGGIGGWQGWDYYRDKHATEAASLYVAFAKKIEAAADDALPELPPRDYEDTPYLPFAYFRRAQYLVEHGKPEEAIEDLRWVAENSVQPTLSELAYVRLARVLVSMDEPDQAQTLLENKIFSESFIPLVQEVQGDALLAMDDIEGAAALYRSAWVASQTKPEFLRLKLESLGQPTDALAPPGQ